MALSKKWGVVYSNGKKPNENHLAAIFDSYVHKTDTIPADRIEDLDQILRLNTGMTREEVEALIASHNDSPTAHNIGTADEFAVPPSGDCFCTF